MVLSTVVKQMVERWDCQIEMCGNRSCFSISKRAIRAATERDATSNGRAKFLLYPLCGITHPIGVTGHYTRMGYLARCFGESRAALISLPPIPPVWYATARFGRAAEWRK